jgi:hypothetical protein
MNHHVKNHLKNGLMKSLNPLKRSLNENALH